MTSSVAKALLTWYENHARVLPWRETRDPYAIWVSEVMLQQTRVQAVLPYYRRWMESFPTIDALADADLDLVLSRWEGLGYYRRAHNLHQAAQYVMTHYGGTLPRNIDELRQLPGIGPYIAAAIAALAFNQDVIALDGNLRRVISRVIDLDLDPRTPEGERRERTWALDHLPAGSASAFNQAWMDLGALICTPKSPSCEQCPLKLHCESYANSTQALRPVRSPKSPTPHREVAAGVLLRNEKVLIGRRPQNGLLAGLWEFPGGTKEAGETLPQCLQREWQEELGVSVDIDRFLGKFEHAYTHFRVTVSAFLCHLLGGEPAALEHSEILWVSLHNLDDYPMGKIDRMIARVLASNSESSNLK
jgi:A/G-specific adenine glycosylase